MDNSNIIISIIIVLCIAAGVTAYGISEGDNAVFNDLTGFSPDSGSDSNGVDLTGTDSNDGTGSDTSNGGSSGSSSSGSNGGTHSNGGRNSGGSGGSGSGGNGGNGGSNSTSNKITAEQAKAIATSFIGTPGAYVSNVKDDGSQYVCYISDENGTHVDTIAISYTGENLGRC